MKTLKLLLVLTLALSSFAFASEITCHTPRMNKVFKISDHKVTFVGSEQGRHIASVVNLRTRVTPTGFTKVMNYEGNKLSIHVENKESFSEVSDYLSIRSPKGHEIIYPIFCE